ncbi:SgrR family transcriptional regulator [Bacillus sp. 3103sda1]|uniref:SgrR family transcriptional regulator n=1 Tax=Bacillus sp. 3103sda1 TaxID=2953808 RepID=UPI0020A2286B|nr:SgrR family transcriptional regulator [Bacillus sp. 3103sda1]MCP1123985.1 SgrR family transcriptional regulator [Bacillus sp. 3103sda1]
MIILDHYIRLWLQHAKGKELGENIEISLQDISKSLYCTDRNSKFTIKKLEEMQWISWSPGRGRGNRSKLAFLQEPEALIYERGKKLVKQGEVKNGKAFIQTYAEYFPYILKQFQTWIDTLFGYHIEQSPKGRMDVLRLNMRINPITCLDPMYVTLRSECHIVKHVCDTLVHYNEMTNEIEPRLAFYWEYNHIHKIWTFYLRKGVHFHNQKPFTAHDVKYTFKRFLSTKDNPHLWMLQDIEKIHIVDEYTIEIHLQTENELFLHILGGEHCSIIPELQEKENDQYILNGTGPFKLLKNDDALLILEVNHLYFRERPFLDRIELWYFQDISSHSGYEVLLGSLHHDRKSVKKETSQLEANVTYITLNTKKQGPMQHIAFRQALKQIINGVQILNDLKGERGEIATNLLLGKTIEINKESSIKELLGISGYKGETLYLYTFQDQDHVEDSHWIQRECAKYGMKIEISFLDAHELLTPHIIQKADLIHDSATISEHAELSYLYLLLTTNSFLHQHSSFNLNEKLKRVFKEQDPNVRMRFLEETEQELLQHIHVIPLYRNYMTIHTHEGVQNVAINSQGWINFYQIWFKHTNNVTK